MIKLKTLRVRNGKLYERNSYGEWVKRHPHTTIKLANGVYRLTICASIKSSNNYVQKLNYDYKKQG